MEGTIKWFNVKKGYGFIVGEDQKEYFVHYTALPRDKRVHENDKVSFEPVDSERGIQAQNVQILGAGQAPQQEVPQVQEETLEADDADQEDDISDEDDELSDEDDEDKV